MWKKWKQVFVVVQLGFWLFCRCVKYNVSPHVVADSTHWSWHRQAEKEKAETFKVCVIFSEFRKSLFVSSSRFTAA